MEHIFLHPLSNVQLTKVRKGRGFSVCAFNLRLLSLKQSGYKEGDMRKWDIKPECIDLDASTSHFDALDVEDQLASKHESASGSGNGTACGPPNLPVSTSSNMDGDDILEDPYDDA